MNRLEQIEQDLIKALKARDQQKVTVLRSLKSELKYRRIEKKGNLTDEDVIAVLSSYAKKCRESLSDFEKGGRDDLVQKAKMELDIVTTYLPRQLPEDELRSIIKTAIEETGADSPQKLGLVMKAVMPKIKGKADGKLVNKLASEMLAN